MSAANSPGAALTTITSDRGSRPLPTEPDASSPRLRLPRVVPVVAEALAQLVRFDVVATRGYQHVYDYTTTRRVIERRPAPFTTALVCRAVEEACVWYYKSVFCLQRATVVTWMLRRRGLHAELVIGYRPAPVDSHAWVEVNGVVVNDRPQYQKFYRVLARY